MTSRLHSSLPYSFPGHFSCARTPPSTSLQAYLRLLANLCYEYVSQVDRSQYSTSLPFSLFQFFYRSTLCNHKNTTSFPPTVQFQVLRLIALHIVFFVAHAGSLVTSVYSHIVQSELPFGHKGGEEP